MKFNPKYILMGAAFVIGGIADLCTEKLHSTEIKDEVAKEVAKQMKNLKK